MKWHRVFRLAWAVALTLPLAACSPIEEDVCDAQCECTYCTDRDYDLCMDHFDYWEREADYWDCEDEYDTWMQCQDATGYCNRGGWSTSCSNEKAQLNYCTGRYDYYQ